MFKARPQGYTLRRLEEALYKPAPPSERFDADHPVAWKCDRCGKIGHGPRRFLEDAIDEHRKHCSARITQENKADVLITRLFAPRT